MKTNASIWGYIVPLNKYINKAIKTVESILCTKTYCPKKVWD